MRKILSYTAPVLVLVGAVAVSVGLSAAKPPAEKKVEAPRPISLFVDPVKKETVTLAAKTQGEVRAKTEVNIISQVAGRIVSVSDHYVEGGAFDSQETLIKIDDSNYRLAVTRAEAQVAEAKVNLEKQLADARIKAKQWKDWVKDGEPTALALNKPQVTEAQAKLRAAEANLEEAKLELSRTEIRLPFQGRIVERNAGVGQFISIGTILGRAFSTDVVEIKLPLTDSQLRELDLQIGFIAKDNAPKVTFSTSLAGDTTTWTGEIKRVNASIDRRTRLTYAIAEVNDPYGAGSSNGTPLAVGLFVNADIAGTKPQSTLVVPRVALRSKDKVYVVNKDNKLEIRTVEILANDKDFLMVSSGLKEGEQVVTSTLATPVNGMDVIAVPNNKDASNLVAQASR